MKLLVNIDVPALAPALDFYLPAFGLHVGRRFGDDAIELLGADAPIYLLHKAPATVAAGDCRRDYARHWTPIHCDVVVDDLDAAEAAVLKLGATKHEHQPGTTFRVFLDPAGHPLCLCLT